ncbi:hypothetical protein ACFR97_15370 [Haloplanus litoreus]|uniref:Uncharacterized protein n=1 Tax=Haloplanus litoreus TaxID=767515 RepID=A0ABD5ZXK6_9EURY
MSNSRRRSTWAWGAAAVSPLGWSTADVSALADAGPFRAVASALLVLAVGAALRYRWPGAVDRAVDATLARPKRTPVYGVAAAAVGWLVVAYGFAQAFRLGNGLGTAAVVLGVGGVLAVSGAGFVVLGTTVVSVLDGEWTWTGPLVGAGISGLVWLALPLGPALVVWILLAATGLGGPTRRWVHASRQVERVVEE